jgi:hypothetical protein
VVLGPHRLAVVIPGRWIVLENLVLELVEAVALEVIKVYDVAA